MIRKEILDTLRQACTGLSFLLLVPVIFSINEAALANNPNIDQYMQIGLSFVLPATALYIAYMMFAGEDRDSAMEYLKTLPIADRRFLAIKILPRLILISAAFLTPWARRNLVYWYSDPLNDFLYSTSMPVIITLSGFFLGISNRRNSVLVAAFLIPILFLAKFGGTIGGSTALANKLALCFYRHVMLPTGMDQTWVFRLASRFFYILTTYLPALLPVTVIFHFHRQWDCSSKSVKTQLILGKMVVPLGILLGIYLLNTLRPW